MNPDVHILYERLSSRARELADPRVSYTEAGSWINQAADSEALRQALAELIEANHASGEPLLSALVVYFHPYGGGLGLPGRGFWTAAQQVGAQPLGVDNLRFWITQFDAVQALWLARGPRTLGGTATPDDEEYRRKLLENLRDVIHTRELSNSENYDKAILSLATAFLGFSIAFIKDIVPLDSAQLRALLPISWCLLALAVVATIGSFLTSQIALGRTLSDAEAYYLDQKEEYQDRPNPWSNWTQRLVLIAGSCFVSAVIATILFASINLIGGSVSRSENIQKGAKVPSIQPATSPSTANDGAPTPTVQQIPKTSGNTPKGGASGNGSSSTK